MNKEIHGNIFNIYWSANELSSNVVTVNLADGYSFRKILILNSPNISLIEDNIPAINGRLLDFPVVNGSSPCNFKIRISDITKSASLAILIEKFGQKPDIHYFDTAFNPILVTGKDGEEYNMIPSDQFK